MCTVSVFVLFAYWFRVYKSSKLALDKLFLTLCLFAKINHQIISRPISQSASSFNPRSLPQNKSEVGGPHRERLDTLGQHQPYGP